MLPSKSNLSKENCSPTSSNCVIWQGPDIACINLCTGDTISDVTYKLALEICELKDNIGVTDIELACLVEVCQTTPEPAKTLSNILELLISKVCCLWQIVDNLPTPGEPYIEPTLIFPACAAFTGLSPQLHRTYTVTLANKICTLNTTINQNTLDIDVLKDKVQDLEDLVPTPLPELNSCLTGTDKVLDDLVEYLENEFCDIKDALGEAGDITVASSQECEDLSSQKSLSDSTKFMSQLSGNGGSWILNPENLAQSINNLWLTVCDIRGAVRGILDNCCAPTCDAIKIDFYQRWSSDSPTILQLNFRSKSTLPLGFYDCGQPTLGNELTFTDADGFVYPYPIVFRSIDYPTDTNGALDDNSNFGWVDIDLTTVGLNLSKPISITADLCFTNGSLECIQCVQWTINPSTGACCEIIATDTVTITYKTC